jgi:DNA-binding NtrC family response regulator
VKQERTIQREVHWVVRGGTARTPDGAAHAIDVDPVVVGRDPGANVVLAADPEVSMAHCELRAVADGILVRDLGSTNGTYVGAFRVREGIVRTPTAVTVGRTSLLVEPSAEHRVDVGWSDGFGPMVGRSPRMRRVFGVLERIAPTPLSVLILGETGTGKELVAKAVHDASPRARQPFVVVDCGSIPPTLAESILFGHEKGAFTGADVRRKGALAEADGGTLFLDELGELPLELQPKLLRALSEKQVKRVGASAFEPIDVRVLAATRRDITTEMNAGRFRSDLYFRIAQVRIELPPLRERVGDIPQLVEDVCTKAGRREHAAAVVAWIQQNLAAHDWPGNVRELVNVASVAATLADTPGAIDDVLALTRDPSTDEARAPITAFAEAKRQALIEFERSYFTALSEAAAGNVSEMARQSGMERHHVRAYLRKHKIGGLAKP